jgi:hypothetical protein
MQTTPVTALSDALRVAFIGTAVVTALIGAFLMLVKSVTQLASRGGRGPRVQHEEIIRVKSGEHHTTASEHVARSGRNETASPKSPMDVALSNHPGARATLSGERFSSSHP